MDFGISGKLALVTGGSSGLGLAVCETLAAEGVNLVLFSRDSAKLAAAAGRLRERFPVDAETIAGDMTSSDDVRALARRLKDSGKPDILVLNTARPPSPMREFLDETDEERWEEAYQQQLKGAMSLLRAVVPLMLEKGWGRIIAITSATVKQPMPKHAISTVFRAGLQGALKHLAYEVGHKGITVNSVAPATILTESLARYHNLEERAKGNALKRLGKPEELAATVVFLASRQAGYITGQVLQVDGGMTASLV